MAYGNTSKREIDQFISKLKESGNRITREQLARLPGRIARGLLEYLKDNRPPAAIAASANVSRETPELFITEVLGEKPTEAARNYGYTTPWTPQQGIVLAAVNRAAAEGYRRIAIHSGHSVGKDWLCARLVGWRLCRRRSMVITTGPDARQVEDVLWGEIHEMFRKSRTALPGRLLKSKWEISEDDRWFAYGFTARTETAETSAPGAAGRHVPDMMAILDEAPGIQQQIVEGIEGMLVNPEDLIIAIANPTRSTGWFRDACHSRNWKVIHLDSRDHPNVVHDDHLIVPGAVSRVWIDERLKMYGSESAPLFQSKVIGIFPTQTSDTLISVDWLEACKEFPGNEDDVRGDVLGMDVSGEGEDINPVSRIRKCRWEIPEVDGKRAWHQGKNPMAAVNLIQRLVWQGREQGHDVAALAIDDTSMGSAVSGRIMELQREGKLPGFAVIRDGRNVVERRAWLIRCNFGARAWDTKKFDLLKDELWWMAREALRNTELGMPTDEVFAGWGLPKSSDIFAQLTAPIYDSDHHGGRIVVFDKRSAGRAAGDPQLSQKVKSLPEKSPDVAHSFILAVAAWKKLWRSSFNPKKAEPTGLLDMFWRQVREEITASQPFRRPKTGGGSPETDVW